MAKPILYISEDGELLTDFKGDFGLFVFNVTGVRMYPAIKSRIFFIKQPINYGNR